MVFCTKCGAKNEDDVKFCNACGNPMAGVSSQAAAAPPPPPPPPQQPAKCPGCGAPIGSFQTKCSTCGMELNTAQGEEAVKSFFKKLEDLTQKEYEANKQREGSAKKKKKQPKLVVLCEAIAVMSLILIILHATGINRTILNFIGGGATSAYTAATASTSVLSGNTYVIESGDMALAFASGNFAMVADDGSRETGSYRVSGNSATLTTSGGNTMRITIVNDTTLRDGDNDTWRLRTTTLSDQTYVIGSGDMALAFAATGNRFAMVADDDSQEIGTYKVSGNSVTLTISSGNTMSLTIVNDTTLRDSDGDTWRLRR